MAVEITPTVGCATCAGPLCPSCLGCTADGHAGGCLCPSVEYSAERVAARQAWLDASRRLCPDLWQHCDVLGRLEAREDSLHHQIAALGGF